MSVPPVNPTIFIDINDYLVAVGIRVIIFSNVFSKDAMIWYCLSLYQFYRNLGKSSSSNCWFIKEYTSYPLKALVNQLLC